MADKNTLNAIRARLAQEEAARPWLPKGTLFGLVEQESSWNPNAKSGAGALG